MLRCVFLLCSVVTVYAANANGSGSGANSKSSGSVINHGGSGSGKGSGPAVSGPGSTAGSASGHSGAGPAVLTVQGGGPSGSGTGHNGSGSVLSGHGSGANEKSNGSNVSESGHGGSGGGGRDISGHGTTPGHIEPKTPAGTSAHDHNDCSYHFQNVADCLVAAFDQNDARVRALFENKTQTLERCFSNNKCKVPKATVASKKEQCDKAVFDKTKSSVQNCMKQKFPSLKLPDMKFNHSSMPLFHPDRLCEILNDSCPAGANRTSVAVCLGKSFESDFAAIRNDFEQFCKDDMLCLKKLPSSCQRQFFDVKDAAENCIRDAMEKNITGIPECRTIDQRSPKEEQCSFGLRGMPTNPVHGIRGKPPNPKFAGNKLNICGSLQDYQSSNFEFRGRNGW